MKGAAFIVVIADELCVVQALVRRVFVIPPSIDVRRKKNQSGAVTGCPMATDFIYLRCQSLVAMYCKEIDRFPTSPFNS